MENTLKLLIVAGETSGDSHAATVMAELRKHASPVAFFGIGGDKMIAQGLQPLYHSSRLSFLGFTEVVRHLPFIAKVKRELLELVKREKIRTAVLVDYPGFNLNLAAALKKNGVRVVYYISPQVWAWRKGRMKKIAARVDKMMTILPFEEAMYRQAGIDAEFVGHPLIEQIDEYPFRTKAELYQKYELDPAKEILLILPGSRKQEVTRIFPAIREGIDRITATYNLQPVVVCAPAIDKAALESVSRGSLTIVHDDVYSFMKQAKFGIIKSGTSTLEAGLIGLPMIVVYKTSSVTYAIGKRVIEIDSISLVNIVLGKKVAPELIQHEVSAKNLFATAAEFLSSPDKYSAYKASLSALREVIGAKTAARRAAEIIIEEAHEDQRN
jgi:lipid-A-disaccharide synthase